MITTLLFDFSRVILHTKDRNYPGSLNELHSKLSSTKDYSFFDHYELNTELLEFLKSYKNKYTLAIYTTGSIQNVPNVRSKIDQVFSKIYTVHEIGLSKENHEAYDHIAKDLQKNHDEILFIDDQSVNVEAAQSAGLTGHIYENNQKLFEYLKKL
jgi:HAD superfamily hydrolase (TIGR01509 family)